MKDVKKEKEVFQCFFNQKSSNILVSLRQNTRDIYITVLAKEADCTYNGALKILKKMEKANLVQSVKQKRIKVIKLTDKGNKVAEHVGEIRRILQRKFSS